MNIAIIRAFITLRQVIGKNTEIESKLSELENKYDRQFEDIHQALNYLLKKEELETNQKERKPIGYK